MRIAGIVSIGAVGILALLIASKANAATAGKTNAAPSPTPKPKPKATPLVNNAPVTGLPPEIAKLIEAANASTDPVFVRQVAEQLSEKYTMQAINLLNYAAILDGTAVPPVASTPGS